MLRVDSLAVRRGGRTIIEDISLAAAPAEIVGVVGKNGCGKSTLLTCIAGVLPPRDGVVEIDGASVWGSHAERTRARAALGYVPEAADPPGFMTGAELWALCAAARRCDPPTAALRDALGLDELADKPLDKLSLGQRRRACLGAAFVGPPKLLVLDEPDNGLDVKHLGRLIELMKAHAAAGGACILASHDDALLDALAARRFAL
ncbi:MAG: ABC transporter ATP-binding protein [Deltaproteobacteria bacterium]|nr:ABC transporter ATP-binding protein [Deltaproteobacteria bacterium]